jgi:hypothetical protein
MVLTDKLTEMSTSLDTYVMVFDENMQLSTGSATLLGKTPKLPGGVLEYTKKHGKDIITWQPMTGVRSAIVILPFSGEKNGFVLVGRSLLEVERKENKMLKIAGLGWVSSMLVTAVYLGWPKKKTTTPDDQL